MHDVLGYLDYRGQGGRCGCGEMGEPLVEGWEVTEEIVMPSRGGGGGGGGDAPR